MKEDAIEATAPKFDFYKTEKVKDLPLYTAGRLLDAVKKELGLRNDAQLARALELKPSGVSKLRHDVLPVSPLVMLRVIEATGWPVPKIRSLIGA